MIGKQLEPDFENCPPNADAMIQSMRSFGYDLSMAIADIIDNSITAKAKNIWVIPNWGGADSYISTLDDGCGMDEPTLVEAMRLGTTNPLDERAPEDLGRFGLGLKTASFSQCSLLTVRTKTRNGELATRCWDLDIFKRDGKWPLLKHARPQSEKFLEPLTRVKSGTIVLWQKLDRVVEVEDADDEQGKDHFLSKIAMVQKYLEMIFHRYIGFGGSLGIHINSPEDFGEEFTRLRPWDPFLSGHSATQELSNEAVKLLGDRINVKPYVLPHISKLSSIEHTNAAGPNGWNAQQGFYVYRKGRLIVSGGWLGLGYKQEDHYKLARILIDIPNNMDKEWKIDVKKAVAHPPDAIRSRVRTLAKLTRDRAARVYRHRGQIIRREQDNVSRFVWLKKQNRGRVFYQVDRKHPIVEELIKKHPDAKKDTTILLRLVEKMVPIEQIVITNAEQPDSHISREASGDFDKMPVKQWFLDQVRIQMNEGLSKDEAIQLVITMEPFNNYPELVAALEDEI